MPDAARAPVRVSVELFNLLQTSLQYSRLSNGVFDITYASVGYLYDYRKHIRPDSKAIAAALPGVDYRQLKLDPGAHRGLRQARHAHRPGRHRQGLCRGSRHRAAQAQGFDRAMVNSGGDTRVIGDR